MNRLMIAVAGALLGLTLFAAPGEAQGDDCCGGGQGCCNPPQSCCAR
ncbi:MAG: hypothetical protein AB1758_08975 [Candidatus Eremiobacterota bacterium]